MEARIQLKREVDELHAVKGDHAQVSRFAEDIERFKEKSYAILTPAERETVDRYEREVQLMLDRRSSAIGFQNTVVDEMVYKEDGDA